MRVGLIIWGERWVWVWGGEGEVGGWSLGKRKGKGKGRAGLMYGSMVSWWGFWEGVFTRRWDVSMFFLWGLGVGGEVGLRD